MKLTTLSLFAILSLGMGAASPLQSQPQSSNHLSIYNATPTHQVDYSQLDQAIEEDEYVYRLSPGQVCTINIQGDLECQNMSAEPEYATGERVWSDIYPHFKPNPHAPTCHLKKEHLLSAFSNAITSQDINKIIETYHWEGKTISQSKDIIEKLSLISPNGQWQRSYIVNWTGPSSLIDDLDVYVRWDQEDVSHSFSFQKTLDCWFLEFTPPPQTYVTLDNIKSTYRVTNQIDMSVAVRDEEEREEEFNFILVR